MNEKEMVAKLREFVIANGGYRKAAKLLNISHSGICECVLGKRPISNNLAMKLGYEKHITYKEKPCKKRINEKITLTSTNTM